MSTSTNLKRSLIQITSNHLGLSFREDQNFLDTYYGEESLHDFLDGKKNLLAAYWDSSEKKINYLNEIPSLNNRIVVFYKSKIGVLTEDNFLQNLQVISIHGSPTSALYHALDIVYAPLINKNERNGNTVGKQLENLQATLRTSLSDSERFDSNVIDSVEKEFEYWNALANANESAASFRDILQPVAKSFKILEALSFDDVEDALEEAHTVLDDLWKHTPATFERIRIEHLMELIASEVCDYNEKRFKSIDVWKEEYNVVVELLDQCIGLGKKWLSSCKELTEIFWPNYSLRVWKGNVYIPGALEKQVTRLKEILNVKTVYKQLIRLLSAEERKDFESDDLFKVYKDLDVLSCKADDWNKSMVQFEYILQPAEQKVAQKLKKQLSSINTNTRQLLHEFSRYSELINRPSVKSTLFNEREFLLNALQDYLMNLASQTTEIPRLSNRYETPKIVAEIITIRQLEGKANEVLSVSSELLNDLKGYQDLRMNVQTLIKDLRAQHGELYESWTDEMLSQIKKKTLSLCETDPVVKFTSDKLMQVNYSPRLVTLISEVRQLVALGYDVPAQIIETTQHAKKFVKYAKYLEQIANFHNTIGDMMIPSQRPMMLSSAVALSQLVQQQKVASWGDTKWVENYVEKLKTAVDKLSKENKVLTMYNSDVLEKIDQLYDADLIKHYDKWKNVVKHVRGIINQVELKGFKSLQNWKMEIDKNFCKALEHQYIKCLAMAHLYLPEIYCNLVYRNDSLHFSPDEEALKEKYEQQMKKFLDIPKNFTGVGNNREVFGEIINRCHDKLLKVKSNTDNLFEQLEGAKKHWKSWLTLGSLDVTQLKTWQNWNYHFQLTKSFGQEIAKLPSSQEKIGCLIIGLTRLKNDLEIHNRAYWDQLVTTLKEAIVNDVIKLQDYVDNSMVVLNKKHTTMEDMTTAGASYSDIILQRPDMEKIHEATLQKVQVLASWTREKVDSVNRLLTSWNRLENLLENYHHIITKQVETMKGTFDTESENLNREIERFGAKWEQVKPRPNSGQITTESLEQLNKHFTDILSKKSQWEELKLRTEKLKHDYIKFNMQPPAILGDAIDTDLQDELTSWNVFGDFYKVLETLNQEEWIVFRKKIYKLEDQLVDWRENLEKLTNTPLITRLLQEIHKYQDVIPVLKYLRGDDFIDKHWLEVFSLLGIKARSLDEVILRDFLNSSERLLEKQEDLRSICKKAASEVVVRQALAELDQWEVQARFILNPHKDSRGKDIYLIRDFKDILNSIGDNQSLLQSVKNSADYDSFLERAHLWEKRLSALDLHLSMLAQIQRKWVYLEPIFGSGTLNQEKNRFDRIDHDFRNVMRSVEKETLVCSLCRYPKLKAIMENLSEQLTRCQKSLDEFLAEKRNKFPRFLFLNDDDLLEVVGQSSKEQVIQSHLKKLFAGIHSIVLDSANQHLIAIKSLQGEEVLLMKSVDINQPVEDWLNNLVKEMQRTLKELLVSCVAEGKSPDPLKYPSQILCLAENINFVKKCEEAIAEMSLPQLLNYYKNQWSYYSKLDLNEGSGDFNVTDEDGNYLLEIKLKSLLLDTIHHISTIEELIESNITKVNDWTWQKQLRFYTDKNGIVTARMVNAAIEYGFEYIGNGQKLVRTPLTDKCFLILTQAMHLGMGGNPYGPAGTGKTESVKALGSLLGRQVLVFNCDEGIDAASMGRILSGLIRSGAWGCFDEFNRLDEATLSAISMHIQPIQNALRTKQSTMILLDQEIQVNKHCGIFVTLNPVGGGYGGRNKLPDNLKQLFRPVVMTYPDHEQIAVTLLHCDGFSNAKEIGRKLIELFQLAGKLLSNQQHYDWGLRALRTVLAGCADSMKERKKQKLDLTPDVEMALVIKSIKSDTLSKLTFSDGEIFNGLITDIFTGVPLITDEGTNDVFVQSLKSAFDDLHLQPNERQINKCIELYEQLKQRMGVAIVGPPSCGKTTIRKILFLALNKMSRVLREHILNPKSMPRQQLLGQIDPKTRQWSDGVLTQFSLQITAESSDIWSFVICDGDIDPEWVETLNSVLDDNRLLSLPSGWRVQFGPNVNFIFETDNLQHASPATISRMGIVFLSEEDIDPKDYINTCLTGINADLRISAFINDYLLQVINWVQNEVELTIENATVGLIRTTLSQMRNATDKAEAIVGLLNGLGGQLNQDFRQVFAQHVFDIAGEIQPGEPTRAYYNPEKGTIESYHTNPNQSLEMVSSGGKVSLVLTGVVQQTIDALKNWLKPEREEHFMLVGPHGSAKSLILQHAIKDRPDVDLAVIHCSAHVQPEYVIYKILQFCMVVSSNKGRIYKPRRGHLLLYFKNLHLLKNDKWGTNMLVAFLQQLITHGGFFDPITLEWLCVVNVTVVGSLAATTKLSKRFTSILHVYNVALPTHEDINVIVTAYLTSTLKQCMPTNSTWNKTKISKLTTTMINIFNEIKDTFGINDQQHYVFTPHDLITWVEGLSRYKVHGGDIEVFVLETMCHEALRIFHDKLATFTEKSKCKEIIDGILNRDWSKSIMKHISESYYVAFSQLNSKAITQLTRLNPDDWTTIIKKGVIQYSREGYDLNVEIIPELLQLCENLSKTLTRSGGSSLLIGKSGIGRRTAVRIISALQSAKVVQPISSKEQKFKADLKTIIQSAAIEGDSSYLLLEDHVLDKEWILNSLNVLISSGEVPGLYNTMELDNIISELKDEANRENYDGNLYDFFTERTKSKLHVIVCLEKDNENFWKILESCPALLQECSVVWLDDWSDETKRNIPKLLIKRLNDKAPIKIEASDSFLEIESFVNQSIKTPGRYVKLIKTYSDLYLEKLEAISKSRVKLQAGVGKLTEAQEIVNGLKIKAAEQQKKLEEKQIKANRALDMIGDTMKNANVRKEEMVVLKERTEAENKLLVKRKTEIEEELSEVEPLIQGARKAIDNIKTESLSEIRSLRAPPEIIRDILEGVLRLMGIQDTSWNSMKTFLAKRGVKEDIRSFNANTITSENRQAVEKLVQNRKDSFDPKSAKRASVAAAPLAAWVLANLRYSKVVEKIKPLEREQHRLKRNLNEAEMQLGELSAGLSDVDAAVAKLKVQLATYTKEAAELEIELSGAEKTLASAEGLVVKLTDEYQRWQKQLIDLDSELRTLPTYCLLAAGFITYLGGQAEDVRINTLNSWLSVLKTTAFSVEEFLGSEREYMVWQSEGLPGDQLSIQNANIILKSKQCPFLIDPTSKAIDWVKTHLKNKNMEVITQNSPKFSNALELAVRFGNVLLVEEAETISPILLVILRREFLIQGERILINLNGKIVDYHKNFHLLLSTRNAKVRLSADLRALLNVVNFTTTKAGLCEQLLVGAVRQQHPDLENRRKDLLSQREELQQKLHNLQNLLLDDLANATGNILQNKNLLTSLNETKVNSSAISQALNESSNVQQKLHGEYDVYRDISDFSSRLYFAVAEFARTNVMYSLSVSAFVALFLKSLPSPDEMQSGDVYTRKLVVQMLYHYMGRGIFKQHRLTFLLHVAHRMFPDLIPEKEWNFFIGKTISKSETQLDKNNLNWISEQSIHLMITLSVHLPELYGFLNVSDREAWKDFMQSPDCEMHFPKHTANKLTEFQKIIVVKVLRADRLHSSICQCVFNLTGIKSLNLDVLQLHQIYKESTSTQPILLMTTAGNDPSNEIAELAAKLVTTGKYVEVSMGEGQEEKAEKSVIEAAQHGHWLTLKNLHLVTEWLPVFCQQLQSLKVHEHFRLWLVTETNSNFSSVLAENSLKIAYEVPVGIRNNLHRIYSTFGSDFVGKLSSLSAKIFFVLACIHALLQERRKYIPQGWSKLYDFSSSDFSTMIKLASETWNGNNQVQWKFLFGWSYEAIYGGRIEKRQDLYILEAYLKQYFTDEVLSHRWKPLGLSGGLPSNSNYQDYINVIKQLSKDSPSYFGLPDNIDRVWEKNVSLVIVQHLKELEMITNESDKINRDILQKVLTPFMSLWKKLNQNRDFLRVSPTTSLPRQGSTSMNSMGRFINREYSEAILLVQKIHKQFLVLNKISKGFIPTDPVEFQVAKDLLNLRTPNSWLKFWKGPHDPAKYLRDVITKTSVIAEWNNTFETWTSKPLDLSSLFNPDAFLAAYKQNFSRVKHLPLDKLELRTTWKPLSSETAICLKGLLLEGAAFDGVELLPLTSISDSINPVPDCYISWHEMKDDIEERLLQVPLCSSSNREHILTYLTVPCNPKERNKWILSGLTFYLTY